MDKNQTVISIDTKDLAGALVGLGMIVGAYVTYRIMDRFQKNTTKNA